MTAMTGGCQCGRVRFSAAALMDNPHVCHCRMCQKASGNLFIAIVGVKKTDLAWTRGQAAVFESSAGIGRGFCRDCGTPLFFHRISGAHVSLTIGSFDTPSAIPLEFQWGTEARLPQVDQLADLEAYFSEKDDPDGAALALSSNHQHPDHDTDNWP